MVTYKITLEQIEQAEEDAKYLGMAHAKSKVIKLISNRDVIGSLGQQIVHKWLQDMGVDHLYSPPYSPSIASTKKNGDYYDIAILSDDMIYKYIDVKSFSSFCSEKTELHVLKYLRDKELDYLFVHIEKGYSEAKIIGGIKWRDFWTNGHEAREESRFKDQLKIDSYFVYPNELTDPLLFIKQK